MHCKSAYGGCTGRLFGDAKKENIYPTSAGVNDRPYDAVLRYQCEACGWVVKSYSIRFWEIAESSEMFGLADVQKLAEWPPFAPRTPARVTSLIGTDRDLFLKGRRAEIEGMGIGAFSYYRRIIETQKNRLLDAIIRVARHIGATAQTIELLEDAKKETQFSRAVDDVRDAIPPALFIRGYNPLTLLHGALSKGLHNGSDEECLCAATDIRLILVAFAEKLEEAMRDERELDEAVNRIMNRTS
jgi:hypothetical protein